MQTRESQTTCLAHEGIQLKHVHIVANSSKNNIQMAYKGQFSVYNLDRDAL